MIGGYGLVLLMWREAVMASELSESDQAHELRKWKRGERPCRWQCYASTCIKYREIFARVERAAQGGRE